LTLCNAMKRDGSPCTLPARGSNGFCWAHDPGNAEKRRQAASRAGKSKPGREIVDIKVRLKEIAEDVLADRVSTGKGSVAGQLYGVLLRAIEQERRMRELDELARELAELREIVDSRGDERGRSWG
jgi:hypothetical protein